MEAVEEFFRNVTWQQTIFAVGISTLVAIGSDYLLRPFSEWRRQKTTLLVSLDWIVAFSDYITHKGNENHVRPNDTVRLKHELQRAISASTGLEVMRPDNTFISRTRAACQSTLDNVNAGNIKKFRNTNQGNLKKLVPGVKKLSYWGKNEADYLDRRR